MACVCCVEQVMCVCCAPSPFEIKIWLTTASPAASTLSFRGALLVPYRARAPSVATLAQGSVSDRRSCLGSRGRPLQSERDAARGCSPVGRLPRHRCALVRARDCRWSSLALLLVRQRRRCSGPLVRFRRHTTFVCSTQSSSPRGRTRSCYPAPRRGAASPPAGHGRSFRPKRWRPKGSDGHSAPSWMASGTRDFGGDLEDLA